MQAHPTGDINQVVISGTIHNLAHIVKYIPNPMIDFEIHSQRKAVPNKETVIDVIKVVVMNNEQFLERYREGDRILIRGELRSRRFTTNHYRVNPMITKAVRNYMEIFGEFPAVQEPKQWRRELIDWRPLIRSGFMASVPFDSFFDLNGNPVKTDDPAHQKYQYRIDKDGLVYKEVQHTSYEVLAVSDEPLKKPVDPTAGDQNQAVLRGEVRRRTLTRPGAHPLLSVVVRTQTDAQANNHIFLWGTKAEDLYRRMAVGTRIYAEGRMQDRSYIQQIRNADHEKVDKLWTKIEVSCSRILIETSKAGVGRR